MWNEHFQPQLNSLSVTLSEVEGNLPVTSTVPVALELPFGFGKSYEARRTAGCQQQTETHICVASSMCRRMKSKGGS